MPVDEVPGTPLPKAMRDIRTNVTWEASDGRQLAATIRSLDETGACPGDDRRLPLILLHGLSQQRRFWDPVLARLRAPLVAALDQRGHGEALVDLEADFSIHRCGQDVSEFLDRQGWGAAIVIGHSWGASVALRAASADRRIQGLVMIDGGLWGPGRLGNRADVRERLRPPALDLPEADLWAMIQRSSPYLTAEARAALSWTFVVDQNGRARTRIGMDRHMRVLDGLLDYRPEADLASLACPAWAVVCEAARPTRDTTDQAWAEAKRAAVVQAEQVPGLLVHRWMGAVHDVPLQWPALVAGLIDAVYDQISAMPDQIGAMPDQIPDGDGQ